MVEFVLLEDSPELRPLFQEQHLVWNLFGYLVVSALFHLVVVVLVVLPAV